VWGGVALLLLVLLVGSFLLSRGSIEETEQEAERRAEALAASVLFDQLTTDVVVGDILGPDYRELIIAVQAGILSDDRVAQVRIWKTDGDPIFSTAQGDKITEYVKDNPQIQRAAEGETNSLLTGATVAAKSGSRIERAAARDVRAAPPANEPRSPAWCRSTSGTRRSAPRP
jgi:D-alanyl-D-alanine carboxypeptidase